MQVSDEWLKTHVTQCLSSIIFGFIKKKSVIFKVIQFVFAFSFFIGAGFRSFSQVVDYTTKVTIDAKGEKTTQRSMVVQVNSKQENWLSHVEIRHNPKQKLIFHYAHVSDRFGTTIRKLKKKELTTRNDLSYQTFYQDDLITEFDLYWNQYPYQIAYSYSVVEQEYLYTAWWTPTLYTDVLTENASLELVMPTDYDINMHSTTDANLVYEASEAEGLKTHRWKIQNVEPTSEEIYAPPAEKLMPVVKVVPFQFFYGVPGSTNSWATFGNWLSTLNANTETLTFQEKSKVDRLVGGLSGKEEIVKTLYHYLQDHTKYINVAIDVGGLKSYPASYVCENKYGDCKALTTYMKAMLKSVGIESSYSIVKAGSKDGVIDLDLPSQQFNHAILMIPLEQDTLWLENTSSFLPFNYLGTFTQNRHVLAVNGKESRLVKTPALDINHVLTSREYHFQLAQKEVRTRLDLTVRGSEFEDLRFFMSERDEQTQTGKIHKLCGIPQLEIGSWDVSSFHRDSSSLNIIVEGISSNIIREIGAYNVINPLRIKLPSFEDPTIRTSDVIFNYPVNKLDSSSFKLVDYAHSGIQLPDEINLSNEYGSYKASYIIEDDELAVVEHLVLYAGTIAVEDYPSFYHFIETVLNYKKKSAILIR